MSHLFILGRIYKWWAR